MEYHYSISKKHLQEILQQVQLNSIGKIPLKKEFVLSFSKNLISLEKAINCKFEYTFNEINSVSTKYFTIKLESDTLDGVYVSDDDFPITIRNFRNGDRLQLEFGHQKLTTWFNQHKIAWLERQCWPVVLNKNNEIIYVVGWRCDINHSTNNPNLFMIK
jgi:bifunctional protein TilS/HprT